MSLLYIKNLLKLNVILFNKLEDWSQIVVQTYLDNKTDSDSWYVILTGTEKLY